MCEVISKHSLEKRRISSLTCVTDSVLESIFRGPIPLKPVSSTVVIHNEVIVIGFHVKIINRQSNPFQGATRVQGRVKDIRQLTLLAIAVIVWVVVTLNISSTCWESTVRTEDVGIHQLWACSEEIHEVVNRWTTTWLRTLCLGITLHCNSQSYWSFVLMLPENTQGKLNVFKKILTSFQISSWL